MKIVFATNNQHKLDEIRAILGEQFEVLSLNDINCHEDIPETGQTLEENALMKAQYVYDKYHLDCFADDTGLEVEALNGAPGVYSARYAAMAPAVSTSPSAAAEASSQPLSHNSEANMNRLLRELKDKDSRKARFRTIIALIQKKNVCPCGCTSIQEVHRFEGIVNGEITTEKSGVEGFGYDPIFRPDGYDKTFAELGADVKNQISHRARATQKLAEYLKRMAVFIAVLVAHFSLFIDTANAQVGTWRNYLAYHDIQQIQAGGDNIFVMASNGLYMYNQEDQSITTFDKTNGLNDVSITQIAWNKTAKRLVILYDNCNIDLLESNGKITNISEIYQKAITGDKSINSIYIYEQYAYLACGFGIVKLDVKRAEISESYMLGFAVKNITIDNNNIYAEDANGSVWTASLNNNLIDTSYWQQTTTFPSFAQDNSDYEKYYETVSKLNSDGPKYNYFGYLKYLNDRLYSSSHLISNTIPACIQVLQNGEWQIYQDEGVKEKTGYNYGNIFCFDVDPNDPQHVFAGARNGLYEYKNGEFANFYNSTNSPIEGYNGRSTNNQLITGVKFDTSGNLWILNSQAPTTSLIKFSNGEFTKYNHSELMKLEEGGISNKSNTDLRHMIIDSQGLMWFVNNNWRLPAFYQYNIQNNTIKAYEKFVNQDGTSVVVGGGVRCIAEDINNDIWIGTSAGPFLLERSRINEVDPALTQVKVPRNDGTNYADYLLDGLDISAIAIDAGGRKWFGTKDDGVFLISADNMEQICHFTTENSHLLSNTIHSITINQVSGEVFFGTELGLCSYMSDATESYEEMNKDNVYAYPNPVTKDYTGLITIVGLSYNSDVKILSPNGALIAEGRSNGGSFTWNGCDKKGRRVASGVYMVATATKEGKKGTVCKIAIVN